MKSLALIDGGFKPAPLFSQNAKLNPAQSRRLLTEVKVGGAVLGYQESMKMASKGPFNHAIGRIREIEKIIKHRYGTGWIPQTDDAFMYVDVVASLLYCQFGEDCFKYVRGWCSK